MRLVLRSLQSKKRARDCHRLTLDVGESDGNGVGCRVGFHMTVKTS